MKAFVIGDQQGLASLRAIERPDPVPGPGQVLLRVRTVALNHRDLLIAAGQYGPPKPADRIPVSDGVGEVIGLGAGVSGLALGQRVIASHFAGWHDGPWSPLHLGHDLGVSVDGWLAEKIVVPAAAVLALSERISDAQAVTLPAAGTTVWNALVGFAGIKPGDLVLALGTGGVSVMTLHLARLLGARVAITSSSDAKLATMRSLGAEITLNYRSQPDWDSALLEATGGAGADIVVETGGVATLARSINAAAVNGRIALIGALGGYEGGAFSGMLGIVIKNLTLRGITSGSRAQLADLLARVTAAGTAPLVDRVFDFDQAAAAYAYLHAGKHLGKVLIRVGADGVPPR